MNIDVCILKVLLPITCRYTLNANKTNQSYKHRPFSIE